MKYFIAWCFLLLSTVMIAQPDTLKGEIFQVVEEMPMFPGCTDSIGTYAELKKCADRKMLEFMYANIYYPEVDQREGNEGTVVLRFVVEKDGTISNTSIMKNRGIQLGTEALRVLNLMNRLPVRWTPGKQNGEAKRVSFTLPIKFKIKELKEPDFILSPKGDSIYVKFESAAMYKNGDDDLIKYIDESLQYPTEGQDSCQIGIVEVNTLIKADGSIEILEVVDYSKLGFDYQFEAIRLINSTNGSWTAATFGDRKVNTSRSMRITFRPNMVSCGAVIHDFDYADKLVDEALIVIQQGKLEDGIAKLTEAIDLFPDNGEYLSSRGQAYLKMQKPEEACADLKKAKEILVVSWYDSLTTLLCK